MGKLIQSGEQAQRTLIEASRILTDSVAATLGPRGRNVMYGKPFGVPGVVHDGVTVSREVDSPRNEPFLHAAIETLKEAAQKTDDATGDGTTTAIVLTDALLTEGLKLVAAGHNPMILRRGIEPAVTALISELKAIAKPIKNDKEISQIANVSAQNSEIGDIITRAIEKLGRDAVITVEESSAPDISVEYKDGMEFNQGYMSPLFQTDQEVGEAVVTDAHILITDRSLGDITEFAPLLQNIDAAGIKNNLVIIAPDVSGQVLGTILLNKVQGGLSLLAIKAPGFGDGQRAILEDIAVLTGGQVVSSELGGKLEDIDVLASLGHARRVVATKDNTTIVDGSGDAKSVAERVKSIRNQMAKPFVGEFDQEKLQERLAKLTSGIAIINVGAPSEAEMKEKKERIIDAISATRAAIDEGVVPGGETALLKASHVLDRVKKGLTDEEKVGVDLVANAIKEPFRRLMSNSGYDAGEKYAHLSRVTLDKNSGVDVIDGEIKDLLQAGVIDPVKVTRSALANAASTAVMLLTCDVLIVDEPEASNEQG